MTSVEESLPKDIKRNNSTYTVRLMSPEDRNRILEMAQRLSEADILFLRRDITQPDIVDEWVQDVKSGDAKTVLVEDRGSIIGYGSIYYSQFYWNRHLAEVRIMISSPYRNMGLGSEITSELMRLAKEGKIEKVTAYMASWDKGAQKMLGNLGFRAEALLADWVKTRDDSTHDLLIMSASLGEM